MAMPLIAMTYFLPTAVEYRSRRNGRLRRVRVAVAVTGARLEPSVEEEVAIRIDFTLVLLPRQP